MSRAGRTWVRDSVLVGVGSSAPDSSMTRCLLQPSVSNSLNRFQYVDRLKSKLESRWKRIRRSTLQTKTKDDYLLLKFPSPCPVRLRCWPGRGEGTQRRLDGSSLTTGVRDPSGSQTKDLSLCTQGIAQCTVSPSRTLKWRVSSDKERYVREGLLEVCRSHP